MSSLTKARTAVKVGWFLVLALATAFAAWVVLGPWFPQDRIVSVLVLAFFFVHPFGALWMIVRAARFEEKPWRYVALSFVPYSFVWYYFERYRPASARGEAREPGAASVSEESPRTSRGGPRPSIALIGTLYLLTAMLASFRSAFETRIGSAGSMVLFAGAISWWVSKRGWTRWFSVIGSGILALCFVPTAPATLLSLRHYPEFVSGQLMGVILSVTTTLCIIASLIVSIRSLR